MKIFAIFLLFANLLFSNNDMFVISYRTVVVNNKAYNEKFYVAKSMIYKKDLKFLYSFDIEPDNDEIKDFKIFIQNKKDLIIEQLFKKGIVVTDNYSSDKNRQYSKIVLTLAPVFVTVLVKENFVRISVFE